jgi:hypothetical protein
MFLRASKTSEENRKLSHFRAVEHRFASEGYSARLSGYLFPRRQPGQESFAGRNPQAFVGDVLPTHDRGISDLQDLVPPRFRRLRKSHCQRSLLEARLDPISIDTLELARAHRAISIVLPFRARHKCYR